MSEQPGATPKRPVWTREAPGPCDSVVRGIDLGLKIVTLAYTLMAAWQVAKILNPPLQVKQEMVVAAIRQKISKPVPRLPELSNADRAAIYDATR